MFRAELAIAGCAVSLRVHGPFDRERFRARFGLYEVGRSEQGGAPLTLFVDRGGKLLEPADVAYPAVKAYPRPEGVKLLREGLSLYVARELWAEGFVRGPEKVPPLPHAEDAGPADTPLRILVSLLLLRSGRGALLHACGFADEGGAFLFAGPSGAGKTTLASRLPAAGVLSDDQVALLVDDGGARLASTPFVGMYGRSIAPCSSPLRALVLLDQRAPGAASRAAPADRLGALLGCLPLYTRSAGDAAAALAVLSRLLERAAVLRGSPDLDEGVEAWRARLARLL